MKILYGNQFTDKEKKQLIPVIHSNIMVGMKVLCDQVIAFNLQEGITGQDEFETICALDENDGIDGTIGDMIKTLWKDPVIQTVWERRNEYQIIDSVKYYFEKIDEVKSPDYIPTKDDVLQSRARTSGIVTEEYIIDTVPFEMYDVGGQRNERKKWIHCFEGVTAVVFVAALSEYDQTLFEDASTNRVIEALDLFEDICNNHYFLKSSMILFLNKSDLFKNKIATKNIKDYPLFSDFNGKAGSYEDGLAYFQNKFLEKNNNPSRQVYVHPTCATDSKNVKIVFDSCKEIIMQQNMQDAGWGGDD